VRPIPQRYPRRSRGCVRRLAAASVIAATASVASIDAPSAAEDTTTAENAIRSALEKWRSAFNNRNEATVCDLFAEDLIANYQGQPEQDFASLCQLLHTALQSPQTTYHYSLRIDEILVYGEAAVARLVWTLEIERLGAAKEIIEEPAVDILRHQPDGSWKISRYLAYSASQRVF
jgi:ketosteroid isomerase-like protein